MPEEIPAPTDGRFDAAVEQIDLYLGEANGAGRLRQSMVSRYPKGAFVQGWQLSVGDFPDGVTRALHILITRDFPYQSPRIAIPNAPSVLSWPHLERGGLLCLSGDRRPTPEQPVEMVQSALWDAHRLISANINGDNRGDFRTEFLSYWSLDATDDAVRVTSLLSPEAPSREVILAVWERRWIFADNEEALDRWLGHVGVAETERAKIRPRAAAFLWLSEPLLPEEYPRTGSDVRTLADAAGGERVLEQVLDAKAKSVDVIIGAPTANGVALAEVTVLRPPLTGPRGHRTDPVLHGFRAHTIPPRRLVGRYFASRAEVRRRAVDRADHDWVHGRDHDSHQNRLRTQRVAILGCGSLGAVVARNLAQSGVGNLLLADSEYLEWPNVGRHVLGAAQVHKAKAESLRTEIVRSFPHINEVIARNQSVRASDRELMDELLTCDLVVSTMGNWEGEAFLNEWQQGLATAPLILYGWLEAAASAAHAVVCAPSGPCLRCGTDAGGQPVLPVTAWPEGNGLLQEPGCAATFTPYGPSQLAWGQALVTRTALDCLTNPQTPVAVHRSWIGYRDDVEAAGGAWAPEWIESMGDPGTGGITVERAWPRNSSCPVCSRTTVVA